MHWVNRKNWENFEDYSRGPRLLDIAFHHV